MEWLDLPRGTLVAFDTAPLIYLIEEHPIWLPIIQPFFEAISQGHLQGTEQAALLRAKYGLRTPDAIQLATAQEAGASSFVTNDGSAIAARYSTDHQPETITAHFIVTIKTRR